MIQWLRIKFSSIQRTAKSRFSFIAVCFILSFFIYVILFSDRIRESQNVSSVLLFVLGTIYTNFFKDITPDNVVSTLGTLAQCNATILAIVISLSLVVIEFSASKYSARVVDVFKKTQYCGDFYYYMVYRYFIQFI
jgi:uncharacterized membrane protein